MLTQGYAQGILRVQHQSKFCCGPAIVLYMNLTILYNVFVRYSGITIVILGMYLMLCLAVVTCC